jgi:hypothetical protein
MICRKFPLYLAVHMLPGGISHAAPFAPPADGPVPFRRDRLPLDPDAMARISRELEKLAGAAPGETPEDRRGAAQMLALSLALDPGNSAGRSLLRALSRGSHQPAETPEDGDFRKDIREAAAWLRTPEAGADGRALAACLDDVLAIGAPAEPDSVQKGAWSGWIPPLAAYRPAVKPAPADPPTPEKPAPAVRLAKAAIAVPLWTGVGNAGSKRWQYVPQPLEMTAKKWDDATYRFQIRFSHQSQQSPFAPLVPRILAALKKNGTALPDKVIVDFSGEALAGSAGGHDYPGAAAAVLASAALTGIAPYPDAVVIGDLDAAGNLVLPPRFWNQLRSIRPNDAKRLVLPAAAADFLPSILALEHPEFFLSHEVLLAADFKQLVDFTAAKPSAPVAEALARFAEIRDKRGKETTGPYVANIYVRRRLEELGQAAPFHWSARMLAIQGAGKRPIYVNRQVLVAELRTAVEPIGWLADPTHGELSDTEIPRIAPSYEDARKRVEALVRYADTPDRPLIDRVKETLITVRTLERATRARTTDYTAVQAMATAQRAVERSFKDLNITLAGSVGETPEK